MSSNLIGRTLLNQYRVDEFVASGGMGTVYKAWDLKRNVYLAMKVLQSDLAEDPSVLKRFKREANALKKLTHPNIVPFYGVYQTLDFAFLLEKFIDGPSLKDILKQRKGKPLPINDVLIYLKALCAALGYSHANGVVHCDVKPGNVMIDNGGNIFLTDFGIARHTDSTTTTIAASGTPAYMAPEQILANPVTPGTDVYALGVILYEMLTGQRPFRGTEVGTEKSGATAHERIRFGHLQLRPLDPREINPSIPNDISTVILKSLSKDPKERYQTAQELFKALCLSAGVPFERISDRIHLNSFTFIQNNPSDAGGQVVYAEDPIEPKAFEVSRQTEKKSLLIGTHRPVLFGVSLIFTIILLVFIGASVVGFTRNKGILIPSLSNPTSTPVSPFTQTLLSPYTPTPQLYFTADFNNLYDNWSNFLTRGNPNEMQIYTDNGRLVFDLLGKNMQSYFTYDSLIYRDIKISIRHYHTLTTSVW